MRRVFHLLIMYSLAIGSWAQTKQELASEYAGIVDSLMQAEQYDSAAYYVTLRAELDTTNAGWQFDAGYCLNMMENIEDATLYYNRALRLYKQLAEKSPSDYIEYVLMTLDYSAHMYQDAWLDNECEASYKEMLGIYRQLVRDNPQRYKPGLAMTLNNMGFFYQNIHLFEQGEPLYKEALELYRYLTKEDAQSYEPGLANTLHNLASLHFETGMYEECEKYGNEALEIYQRLVSVDPDMYEPRIEMLKKYILDLIK